MKTTFTDLSEDKQLIVDTFPYMILIAIGTNILYKLGYDIFTFNDMPQEIPKLAEEVVEAKKFMSKNKIL